MADLEENEFDQAKWILTNIDEIIDPEKRIREFETGIDLLSKYVRENQHLGKTREKDIKELRSFSMKKLLGSLTEVRGGSIKPWIEHVRILLMKMKPELDTVLQRYSQNTIVFPQPLDGSVVQISPPAFTWEFVEGAFGYRIEIKNDSEQLVYKKVVGKDPVHLPNQILPPGYYSWDIISLNAEGLDFARRGKLSFTIGENVPTLPWVDPATLLARVPKDHSRFLYLKSDLPSIRATLYSTRQRSWKNCIEAAEEALNVPIPVYPDLSPE